MTQFNSEPLKEPRGFLRLLQWLFALVAFATCCDFTVKFGFRVECKDANISKTFETVAAYPYRIDQQEDIKFRSPMCGPQDAQHNSTEMGFNFPGDFSSDAQFFVFIGVMTWLYCSATLALYVFYSYLYTDDQKSYPKYDLVIAAVLAFVWLCAASAWAHAVLGLRSIADVEAYIFSDEGEVPDQASPCFKTPAGTFKFTEVKSCTSIGSSGFSKANSSVLIGFLNCFLWAANIWFLYKETAWYRNKNPTIPAGPPGPFGPPGGGDTIP